MTVLRTPPHWADRSAHGRDDSIVHADRARMRALWRHQATVLTISGDVDISNAERVHDFVTRFILVGNALVLDLSGVEFCAARGISMLIAVDDACRAAEVPWALIPSRIVCRVLQLTACDTALPTAISVAEALRQVTALSQARRRVALTTIADLRHALP